MGLQIVLTASGVSAVCIGASVIFFIADEDGLGFLFVFLALVFFFGGLALGSRD